MLSSMNNSVDTNINNQSNNDDQRDIQDGSMMNSIADISDDSKLIYFDEIQKDLLSSPTGGMLIMSQGTGVYKVIGEYLDQFDKGSQTIFFLLNFDDRDSLKTEINEIQFYTKNHNIVDATNLISAKRSDAYNKGGVLSVSEIVLLFDILSANVIHAERITGFIINRIHTVRDHKENLVWLTTLLKTNNPSAIVLGISECEQTLASRGLENMMKWFYMTRCFVWNMIRAEVQNEVIQKKNVCEHLDTSVDMNKRMKNIDNCIKVIIILILKELKAKRNPHETFEYPIFTEEEFLNSHQYLLEDKIKSNKLFYRACMNNIQYLKDAFEFKQLQKDLFQLNCVQFYTKLLNLERNSNDDSFINRTAADKSTSKVIKELFENAQKRIYEIQKSEDVVQISISKDKLQTQPSLFISTHLDQKIKRSDGINQFNQSNEKSNSIQSGQLESRRQSDLKSEVELKVDDPNQLNTTTFREQDSQNSEHDFKLNLKEKETSIRADESNSQFDLLQDKNEISMRDEESNNQFNGQSDETHLKQDKIYKNYDNTKELFMSGGQKLSMTSVQESKTEEEEEEEKKNQQHSETRNDNSSKKENKQMKQDMIGEDLESINYEETIKKDEELVRKINFMQNIIEQDPESLFFDGKKFGNEADYLFLDQDDDPNAIQYEINYRVKLNLDIDPKFKCLSMLLNEINEKYKDCLPINGESFLIWIHTNDKSRVSSIQEYIQNAFLKNDPTNKLSLMKKYRYFLGEQIYKRHNYLQELIKKKKEVQLTDKKDCDNLLLESLYKELDYLFQIIEYEQLEMNKNSNNSLYLPDNFQFDQNKELSSEPKQKNNEPSQENEKNDLEIEERNIKKSPQNKSQGKAYSETSEEEGKRNSVGNKIKRSDRLQLDGEENNRQVRKRKLQIDDKISKRFKTIDVNSMNFNIIDELDTTGRVQFLSKQIMPNFQFIVNSTNKSVIRQNFIRTYRPNFIILFEPNLNIIREVTIYQHLIQTNGVNPIYELRTIMFNKSAESEKTLYNIIQENKATERLVREKNQMANSIDDPVLRVKNITKKANTRVGGQALQLQPTIIIDKREFRSDLPTILFHEGYKIVPIQLNTGDYILSKDIAIERKSVETPDLINSLRNGKLYQQLVAMSKAYKKCYLLIEFSESMPFNLESVNYNTDHALFNQHQDQPDFARRVAKTNTITFYLPLIVSQLDNIKIIWSKGPLHTSKIFQMLKQNQLEPNVQEFLKEQDKKEKKESTIDQYVQANQDQDKYKPTKNTLFEQIKATEEDN